MNIKKEGKHLIKLSADFLLFFSLLYLILCIASVFFGIKGPAAVYESHSPSVSALSYGLSSLSLIASFLGLESVNEIISLKYYRIAGSLLFILNLTALMCFLIKIHTIDLFALVSLICGTVYIIGSYR